MISNVVISGNLANYQYRLEIMNMLAGGRIGKDVGAILTFEIDDVTSTVCTLNKFIQALPEYVEVDDMANEWILPREKVPEFTTWFFRLSEYKVLQWLNKDRKEEEWQ